MSAKLWSQLILRKCTLDIVDQVFKGLLKLSHSFWIGYSGRSEYIFALFSNSSIASSNLFRATTWLPRALAWRILPLTLLLARSGKIFSLTHCHTSCPIQYKHWGHLQLEDQGYSQWMVLALAQADKVDAFFVTVRTSWEAGRQTLWLRVREIQSSLK